jgi:hypothetical protein
VVSDFVNKNRDLLDAILITGDISTTGDNEDLEESLDIIRSYAVGREPL